MFGRLDEDPELSREYMIVSNAYNSNPIVYDIMCPPDDARSTIASELCDQRERTFAVYELVEFVEVDRDGKLVFTEDWCNDYKLPDEVYGDEYKVPEEP